MQQERHVGYEVKALSNLMRRKMWEHVNPPKQEKLTEVESMFLSFLCHNKDQEIFQKDLENVFCIRGSTTSRLLKQLEEEDFIVRCPSARDARLKRVVPTPKAEALHRQIERRIAALEDTLTYGLSQEEIAQFLTTVEKLKQNLLKRPLG